MSRPFTSGRALLGACFGAQQPKGQSFLTKPHSKIQCPSPGMPAYCACSSLQGTPYMACVQEKVATEAPHERGACAGLGGERWTACGW